MSPCVHKFVTKELKRQISKSGNPDGISDLIEHRPEEDPVLQPDVEVELPGQPGLAVPLLRPAHLGYAQRLGRVRQGLQGTDEGQIGTDWGQTGTDWVT